MWIGPKGAVTPLHVDGLDNLLFQFSGSKRWLIIDPTFYSAVKMLQPFPEFPNLHVSEIDLRDNYAGLDEADVQYQVIEIKAGEGFFLPAGWAHFVTTLEPSIMVNLWSSKATCRPRILNLP
jgi:lysine-specific demethylase 8